MQSGIQTKMTCGILFHSDSPIQDQRRRLFEEHLKPMRKIHRRKEEEGCVRSSSHGKKNFPKCKKENLLSVKQVHSWKLVVI